MADSDLLRQAAHNLHVLRELVESLRDWHSGNAFSWAVFPTLRSERRVRLEAAWKQAQAIVDAPLSTALQEAPVQPQWPAGLLERVKGAEQRIADNHAPRRIPADPHGDVDLVLAEVRYLIEGKWPPFWIKDAYGVRVDAPRLLDEDEQWAVDRAADLLERYAEFIQREVMSIDIEQHPYLPEVESVAEHLRAFSKRAAAVQSSHGEVAAGRAHPECEWCTLCGKRDHVEAQCPTVAAGVSASPHQTQPSSHAPASAPPVRIPLVRGPSGEVLRQAERNSACNCAAKRTLCDGINCVRPASAPQGEQCTGCLFDIHGGIAGDPLCPVHGGKP